MRLAALMGMRDAVWGSVLGYLYMSAKLTEEQFHAGDRWTMLARKYHKVMQGPVDPRSVLLTRVRAANSKMMESFSTQITDGVAREGYEQAMVAVRSSTRGAARLKALIRVCELDLLPIGQEQVDDVRGALDVLKNHWFRR